MLWPKSNQSLGIVHVLTGPDHLSAIATLSANVDNRVSAFFLGVRWGIGHSTGLLLVGCIFIVLSLHDDDDDQASSIQIPERVSHAFESLVGIFMLLLGTYGVRKAWDKKRPSVMLYEELDDDGVLVSADRDGFVRNPSSSDIFITDDEEEEARQSNLYRSTELVAAHDELSRDDVAATAEHGIEGYDDNEEVHLDAVCLRYIKSLSLRTMATAAGIVHGLAGPGGVLGVLPAVQLHSARLATIYLGSFCASSTLTMGVFAMIYGTCSSKIGFGSHRDFVIEVLSASLSLLVGVTWLVLLSIGKLDDVFP